MSSRTTTAAAQEPDGDALADAPRGGAWERPFADASWVFFDLEMTGLDARRDGIIEVAALRVEAGREVARLVSLVRAPVASSPDALAVHGITASQLADAPPFEALAGALAELFDGAVPVAHGVRNDLRFLAQAFAPLEGALAARCPRHAVDTLALARRALVLRKSTLRDACEAARVAGSFTFHRAEDDARATRALFEALAPRFAPRTARDLWEVRAGGDPAAPVVVRAQLAAQLAELLRTQRPCAVYVRSRAQPERCLQGVVERFASPLLALRRRGGALALVRADRILRVEPVLLEPPPRA